MFYPSAPPESQSLIDVDKQNVDVNQEYFDKEESKDDSILAMTPNTQNIEKIAAQQLDTTLGASVFKNEHRAAYLWCTFIFVYWTPCIWFPIFYHEQLDSLVEFVIWCIGLFGLMSTSFYLRDGQNPSGSTKQEPNGVYGKGRYAATLLVWCILADFAVKIYDLDHGLLGDPLMYDLILVSGHIVSIFWCSFFYYGRFRQINPEIATFVFVSEWIDIVMCIAVFAMLILYVDDGCSGHYLCHVYFVVIPIKFILWIVPMMMLRGWGTKPNGVRTSIQLFITNIVTDFPIIVMIQYTQLYKMYTMIYIDLCIKSFIIIRGTSYYGIFNIWLQRGLKRQKTVREFVKDAKDGCCAC